MFRVIPVIVDDTSIGVPIFQYAVTRDTVELFSTEELSHDVARSAFANDHSTLYYFLSHC